jgi:glycosyltransferase involved in cell wall biosynthesis
MTNSTHRIVQSIVLPVHNEQDNVEFVYQEITETLRSAGYEYEIIFVDDGSSDASLERLRAIQQRDPRVVVSVLRRNFGQTAAMAAGFDLARGEVIVTLDADRQNDPADIPRLMDKIDEGYDMVCGWRYQRQDGFILRRLPSMIANRIISFTTDVKLHDYGCTLKAFRRDVAKQLSLYGEMHRFIPAIASWLGVNIAEIKVNHRPRVMGQSKYGISRTLRVILDLITVKFLLSYSTRPIQFFGGIGMLCGALGFLLSLYLTIQRLFFQVPLGDRPILMLAVLLIFIGLQFITVGLLAEMITRTYHESQEKPIYVVREVWRTAPVSEHSSGAG